MTQIAQLSAAEIEDRFQIAGTRVVAFTLAGFVRECESFSVHFGDELFVTTLLAVWPERGLLVFDCSGAETLNRRLLQADHCHFVGRPEGIHVQFSVGRVSETLFSGSRAFAVSLPKSIVRLQRRESFRIETPRARPLQFFGRLAEGGTLDLPAHDISVAGIGLTASDLPAGLSPGEALLRCHFHLTDDTHELYCTARVRHLTELEGRFAAQWRIGLQFENLPPVDENRIQRYIVRIERERHELSG